MRWNPITLFLSIFNKRYKPYFRHAKKLFAFDIVLVLTLFFFAITSLLWFFYVPELLQDVEIRIVVETKETLQPLKSGEELTFYIYIKNKSVNKILEEPFFQFIPPKGFQIYKLETPTFMSDDTKRVQLQDISKKQEQLIVINGFFVGSIREEQVANVTLQIKTKNGILPLYKAASLKITPEESSLTTQIDLGKNSIKGDLSPITLTLKNTSRNTLKNTSLDLSPYTNILKNIHVNHGVLNPKFSWILDTLEPEQTAQLWGEIDTTQIDEDNFTFSITPVIQYQQENFLQQKESKSIEIIHPNMYGFSSWEKKFGSPGKEILLHARLENHGNIPLNDIELQIHLPENSVDTKKFETLYNTTREANLQVLHLEKNLEPGQILEIDPLRILLKTKPSGGTQLTIKPTLKFRSHIDGVSQPYTQNIPIEALPISSSLTVEPSIQYYTEALDQIGRGPIPLQKETPTKFWVLLHVGNTTNELSNIKLQGTLSPFTQFTHNTSVSNGPNILLENKNFSWVLPTFTPYDYTRIGFEVEVMPQHDKELPKILENITLTAEDTFTHENIQVTIGSLGAKISDYNENTKKYIQ